MVSRKQIMRNAVIITITLLVCFVQVVPANASAPEDMSLTYDFTSQTLTVNVSHYVSNTKTHYIETIEISRNGISVQNKTYVNQTYNWGVYDSFVISTSVGDNLTVTATCLKGYPITRWVVASSTTTSNSTTTETSSTTIISTTNTTGDSGSPDTPVNLTPVIGVGVFLVILFILLFAWLNPDRVPDAIKQLGSRIKSGLSRVWDGVSNLFGQLKTKMSSR